MFCQSGKRAFGTMRAVRKQILLNVTRGHDAYGFYECPHCLDFHLTKKYDNRTHDFKILCDLFLARYQFNLRKINQREAFNKTRRELLGE